MKTMEEESSNLNNWLGFSLFPHMKMEDNSHFIQPPPTSAAAHNLYYPNPAPILTVDHNSDFQMPLKSDGSLCIMEALSRSHSQSQGVVPSSSPKLEDFLGGATMATHEYANIHPRDDMVLSLDTSFYNQQPFQHQQHHRYYSGYNIYQTVNDQPQQQQDNKHLHLLENEASTHQLPPHLSEQDIPCFKAWMHHHHALQQVNNTSMVETLSLSMSPVSQSSCVTASTQISPTETTECVAMESRKRGAAKLGQKVTVHRKSIDTFGQRTSQYRGVTRHRWTGRYEAHLWDNSCKKEGQTRKGRQVYLGGYDMEEKAARAYDLAALKYWGPSTHINFPLENYHQELEDMKNMSRQEYVAHLRRKSSGFSRGASIYRGVTRHHQHGRWQARIGRVAGNKDLYLGTFSTQEEAAEAYDIAAIKFRGVNAVTNFDISRYDVEKIMASNTLPTGEIARRNKEVKHNAETCGQWKMVMPNANPSHTLDVGTLNLGNYDLMHESTPTMAPPHFSNSSSLATSLSSSREGSPEKYGHGLFLSPSANDDAAAWIPTAQLTAPHLPVFAA